MRFENKKVDKETLDRLEKNGILLKGNAKSIDKQKALILLGDAILDRFVKEFVSLWKELFPNCRLQDFKALEEEKQHILGENGDDGKDGEPTEHNYSQCCQRENCTMDSEDCCDVLTKAKEQGKLRPIFIYRASAGEHSFAAEETGEYKQKIMSAYVRDYHLSNPSMSYQGSKRKLSGVYRRFWNKSNKPRYINSKLEKLKHYRKQRGGNFYGSRLALYKFLESYLS